MKKQDEYKMHQASAMSLQAPERSSGRGLKWDVELGGDVLRRRKVGPE